MNRDDIIRMAREAGFEFNSLGGTYTSGKLDEHLERFAALVAEADKKDADRYRWLRDNNASFSWNPSKYDKETISGFAAFGTGYSGFEFEAAIDKAMGKKQ
jgi:hypothetical protein